MTGLALLHLRLNFLVRVAYHAAVLVFGAVELL